MNKKWIITLAIVLAALIIIQFFRPEKNFSKENMGDDIVFHLQIPTDVKKKLVNACYDCHSNTTRYPFYSRVAPVSWLMAQHIRKGKWNLNFSEWARYEKKEQLELLDDICEMITEGEMPLKSYVFMHSKARFNEKEIGDVCAWAEQAAEVVLGGE